MYMAILRHYCHVSCDYNNVTFHSTEKNMIEYIYILLSCYTQQFLITVLSKSGTSCKMKDDIAAKSFVQLAIDLHVYQWTDTGIYGECKVYIGHARTDSNCSADSTYPDIGSLAHCSQMVSCKVR